MSDKGGGILRCLEAGRWKTISFVLLVLIVSLFPYFGKTMNRHFHISERYQLSCDAVFTFKIKHLQKCCKNFSDLFYM